MERVCKFISIFDVGGNSASSILSTPFDIAYDVRCKKQTIMHYISINLERNIWDNINDALFHRFSPISPETQNVIEKQILNE